jgi:hypothetical protein
LFRAAILFLALAGLVVARRGYKEEQSPQEDMARSKDAI